LEQLMKKLPTLVSLLMGAIVLVSCTAVATHSGVESAVTEEPTTVEAVEPNINELVDPGLTANPDALEMGVHTPEDVVAYFIQWPEDAAHYAEA
jgi:hypothetical protein